MSANVCGQTQNCSLTEIKKVEVSFDIDIGCCQVGRWKRNSEVSCEASHTLASQQTRESYQHNLKKQLR